MWRTLAALWVLMLSCAEPSGPRLQEWPLPPTDVHPALGPTMGMARGAEGAVWLATSNGVSRLQNGQWRNFDRQDGLPKGMPQNIWVARDGAVWLGTSNGIGVYRENQGSGHWQVLRAGDEGAPTLSSDDVTAIFQKATRDDTIWLGTRTGGLSSQRGKIWRSYPTDTQGRTGPRSSEISALEEDSTGRLWVGTSDGISLYRGEDSGPGLGAPTAAGEAAQKIDPARTGDTPRAWTELRFEGEQGKLAPQGLLGNGIRFVKRAPGGGTMWVGTGLGLSRVEEGTGRVVSLAPLGGLSTLLFARDNEGPLAGTGKTRMLLGGSLVNLLWTEPETGQWAHVTGGNLPSESTVSALTRDDNGVIWAGTHRAIWRIQATQGGGFALKQGAQGHVVLKLLATRSGEVWVGTAAGLFRCERDCATTSELAATKKIAKREVRALAEGKDGTLWIGTERGLFSLDAKREKLDERTDGLKLGLRMRTKVNDLAFDAAGLLWIASEDGVAGFHPQTAERWGLGSGRGGRTHTTRMAWDGQGHQYWLSNDRVMRVSGDGKTRRELPHLDALGKLKEAHVAPDGTVWILGRDGVGQYDSTRDRLVLYLALQPMMSLAADESGVWVGLSSGAVHVGADQKMCRLVFRGMTVEESGCRREDLADLPAEERGVMAILPDHVQPSGQRTGLWLGTLGGARVRLEGATMSPEPADVWVGELETALESPITAAIKDRWGARWFGVQGKGLLKVEADGRWRIVGQKQRSTLGAFVIDLFQDENNRLWVLTEDRGVLVMDQNAEAENWRVVQLPEGLGRVHQMVQTHNGTLWFAGRGGVARVQDSLEPSSWVTLPLESLPVTVGPPQLAVSGDDQIWLLDGAFAKGWRLVDKQWEPLDLPLVGGQPVRIKSMASDAQGWVWMGTEGYGVVRMRGRTMEWVGQDGDTRGRGETSSYAGPGRIEQQVQQGLLLGDGMGRRGKVQDKGHETIGSILRDSDGGIWAFGEEPGLGTRIYRYDRKSEKLILMGRGRGEDGSVLRFSPLLVESTGVVWGGPATGVEASSWAAEKKTLLRTVFPVADEDTGGLREVGGMMTLPGTPTKQMLVSQRSLVQVRGTRQLVKYALAADGETSIEAPLADEIEQGTTITDLAPGPEGRIWVGTDTGGLILHRFESGKGPQDEQILDRLPSGTVTSLAVAMREDERQPEGCTLWVGTTGGLVYVSVCTQAGSLLNPASWRVMSLRQMGCTEPPGPVDRLTANRDPELAVGRVIVAYNAMDGSRFGREGLARQRARTRVEYLDFDAKTGRAQCHKLGAAGSTQAVVDAPHPRQTLVDNQRELLSKAKVEAMVYSGKAEVGLYVATTMGLLYTPDVEREALRVVAGEGRLPPMPVAALAMSPDRDRTLWLATMQQGGTAPFVLGYRRNSGWIYVLTQEQGVPSGPSIDGLGFTLDTQDREKGILVVAVGNKLARGPAFVVDAVSRGTLVMVWSLFGTALLGLIGMGLVVLLVLRHPLVLRLRESPEVLRTTLPLATLPLALSRLRWAGAQSEVLGQLGLPGERAALLRTLGPVGTAEHVVTMDLRGLARLVGMIDADRAAVQTLMPGVHLLSARLPHPEKLADHVTAVVGIDPAIWESDARRKLPTVLRAALRAVGHPDPHPFLLLLPSQGGAVLSTNELPLHLHVRETELRALLFSPEPARKLAGLLHARRLLTSSPYSHEGDVKLAAMFFGREALLRDLATAASPQCILVGPRRVGKTSLLKRLTESLRSHRPLLDVYFLDLMGIKSYREAAGALEVALENAARQGKLEAGRSLTSVPPIDPLIAEELQLAALIEARHASTGRRVVVLIDEADGLLATDAAHAYRLLNALRALQAQDICSIVLAGYLFLYRQALEHASPLYNFARVQILGPLDMREAEELARVPMELLSIRYADNDMPAEIARATGGYPSFVQLLCDQLLQELKEDSLLLTREHLRAAERSQRVYDQLVTMLKMNTRRLTQILVYALLDHEQFSAMEAHRVLQEKLARPVPFSIVERALNELRVFSLITLSPAGQGFAWGIPLLRDILRDAEPAYVLQGLLEELEDSDVM